MALDGGEVVEAVLVAAVGIVGLCESLAGWEQELGHDMVDKDVAGNKTTVLVMFEGERGVERVVPGARQLLDVE